MLNNTELTPEELRAIGRSRIKPIIAITASVLAITLALIFLLQPASKSPGLRVAQQPTGQIPVTDYSTLPRAVPDLPLDSVTSGFVDSLIGIQSLPVPTASLPEQSELPDSILRLLNNILKAEVTPEEAALYSRMSLDELLLTPVAGSLPTSISAYWTPDSTGAQPGEAVPRFDSITLVRAVSAALKDSTSRSLDTLAQRISLIQMAFDKLTAHNAKLEQRLIQSVIAADSLRTVEIRRLAKIVESMRPYAAAQMLAGRSSEEITEILFVLKPRTAAQILQELPAARSSEIAARVVRK